MDIYEIYSKSFVSSGVEEISINEFLERCRDEPMCYASPAERLLAAIGEPVVVDTSKDQRLARIFANQTIRTYPSFPEFYGMEETIDRIVAFLRHAAQGLEERKQILYLLGPVGGGKSSLAERLKALMEVNPIYVLKAGDQMSPVFESPLGLFDPEKMGSALEEFGVPRRKLTGLMSPWALTRLDEFGGDISRFGVAKVNPSRLRQIAIAKTEPGDENNQDISSLVGKVDIRKLERLAQNDADAYSFSGGLNRANQGILEFVEMFKAPIKMLHPLLTATQECNYIGTENIGAIPFSGIVLAHSNEAEWLAFKANKSNEAFIDRIYLVKVPYCLRVSEEGKIYEKMIRGSELARAPCATGTIEMLARFSVMTRLKPASNSNIYVKSVVYDGADLKETEHSRAKSITEYRDAAGVDEGMDGVSTRFAFKVLATTFNHDISEKAADPVHLMYALETAIRREQLPQETEKRYLELIKTELAPRYAELIGHEIQKAYLESYDDYGQNLFDRYVDHADSWIEDQDFKDPDTGQLLNRESLNKELEKTEKPAGIANPKDFRNEVVKFSLRARANNGGKNPKWTSYEKIREVIEQRMFSQVEELLPIISFGSKKDSEIEKKHAEFVARMMQRGYTDRQVRRLVEWYMRVKQSA